MALDVRIDDTFDDIRLYLDSTLEKAAMQSARRALNRTITATRTQALRDLKKRLKFQKGQAKKNKDRFRLIKARGGSLNTIKAEIRFSGETLPLIDFVKGSKSVPKQKGIKVRKRKQLRAEIKPGKTFKLKSAFIADIHSKQVFKRRGKRTRQAKKQGLASFATLLSRPRNIKPLLQFTGREFRKVFKHEMSRRVPKFSTGRRIRFK